MSRFFKKLHHSSKSQSTPSSTDAAQQLALPSSTASPKHPEKHDESCAQTQISTALEDVTGLIELWPLRDRLAQEKINVDIVAIHGLNGNPFKTWTENGSFWLQDFLPSAVPNARIFTYGYNSAIAFSGSAARVDDYARYLLERLVAKRRNLSTYDRRPIIFICHSLGGIVLKKALVLAHERSERYHTISSDTFGVMFMGTPHRGSDLAFWGKLFGTIADVLTLGSVRTQLLQDLQPKSLCLGSICSQFVERGQSLRIFTIYERQKMKGLPNLVVDEHSALMNLPNEVAVPIEADHRGMCRFSNQKSEKYQMVFDCLRELLDDALNIEQPCMLPPPYLPYTLQQ
ncbi:uncharacterized protein BDR25DRAFT_41992 [Lindgomyces ingoldianus]|uniref:Uncharacterized protein n=1 Tax=Lindgomyces ingoldianus TaxID=673940 RepID=A0ACB6RDT9_9PLEO|nr:uncharacterized protein BDR25DRAFT_41992 [Lindgomyces ingoldianus]KAF2476890.1 hypothetical protein BDR25DRAFT_41992 [Lindgomyces ingoldianus]